MHLKWFAIFLCISLLASGHVGFGYTDFEMPVTPLTYSSNELRELNTAFSRSIPTTTTMNIPKELNRRKRGKAGGLRRRLRASKQKPYLPSVIMGNVQSLISKTVIDLGLDKEGTFCPTHQNLEGHLKN